MSEPTFFATPAAFRAWLKKNHRTATELLVGYYKTGTGKASITWPESVAEALCFGWIDGVRRSLGDESYVIRFTPRKPTSNWSAVNIRKVEELIQEGRMQEAGLAAFEKRQEKRSAIYSYENAPVDLSREFALRLRADGKATAYLEQEAPSYRRTAIAWVMGAKQQETRERRFRALLEDSAAGRRLKQYRYSSKA